MRAEHTHRRTVRVIVLAALGALLVATSGCHKTLTATVRQPNPLCQPLETLRVSLPAVIVTGDHALRTPNVYRTAGSLRGSDRLPLRNVASFAVVSRDRLKFRVQIEHKWREWADVGGWKATLRDDLGNRYAPESVEVASNQHLARMWDQERRSVVRDRFGDIVQVNNDAHLQRQTLGSLSIFRGRGDLAFYARDIFSAEVRSITLELRRQDRTLSFSWSFRDASEGGELYVNAEGHQRRRPSPHCTSRPPPQVAIGR